MNVLCFRLGNFTEEMAKMNRIEGSGLTNYVMSLFDDKLDWDDVKWLKRFGPLQFIL